MIGTVIQYGAAMVSLLATISLWYSYRRDHYAEYGVYLLGSATLISGFALFYLASQFAVTDYTNGYVWNHSADYLSLLYKVTGVYSGVNGSLLLWATMVGFIAYWYLRSGIETDTKRLIGAISATIATFFFIYAIIRTPFTSLSIASRGTSFGPMGLNPLLKSPYMAIHPPVTFAGYALTLIPFSVGVAHFVTKIRTGSGIFGEWIEATTWWLRLAWWFLTASIPLGALWSYRTLGWGGLWAWDPVETAVLVTWLFVTATVHVVSNYRTRGKNPILAPAMTALTFPSAIFARVMTQSGTSELHSFASGSPMYLTGLLVLTTIAAVGPALYVWLQAEEGTSESSSLLNRSRLLLGGVVSLGLLTFVSAWGLIFPMIQSAIGAPVAGVSVTFFNLWSYPLVIVALLAIGFYNDHDLRGDAAKRFLVLVVITTVLGALIPLSGWQFDPSQTGGYYGVVGSLNVLSLFPPGAYAIGATLIHVWVRISDLKNRDYQLVEGGIGLVHIGIALIILTAPLTYMFAVGGSGLVPGIASGHGEGVSLGDSEYQVQVQNFSSEPVESELELTDQERSIVTTQVKEKGYHATEIQPSVTGNQIVYGTITDTRPGHTSGYAQLDNTSVWADIGPVQENMSLTGIPVYVQGTINRTNTSEVRIQTDGMFIGTEPTGAIVPDRRATHQELTYAVSSGDRTIAEGTTSVDYHLAYGSVAHPTIEFGLLSETYVAAQNIQYSSGYPVISLLVKQVPLMNFVRLGIVMLLIGGALVVLGDPKRGEDRG